MRRPITLGRFFASSTLRLNLQLHMPRFLAIRFFEKWLNQPVRPPNKLTSCKQNRLRTRKDARSKAAVRLRRVEPTMKNDLINQILENTRKRSGSTRSTLWLPACAVVELGSIKLVSARLRPQLGREAESRRQPPRE